MAVFIGVLINIVTLSTFMTDKSKFSICIILWECGTRFIFYHIHRLVALFNIYWACVAVFNGTCICFSWPGIALLKFGTCSVQVQIQASKWKHITFKFVYASICFSYIFVVTVLWSLFILTRRYSILSLSVIILLG